MALEVHPLRLADVTLDTSFRVSQMTPGTEVTAPCTGYLILGGETPVMVDTGIANIFPPFDQTSEQTLQANLARHGLEPGDVGLIVHTHVHVDHVGLRRPASRGADRRPARRAGVRGGPAVPPLPLRPADHAKLTGPLRDRVEIVDGDADIAPGIRTVRTGGHTPHHQMVYVDVPSGRPSSPATTSTPPTRGDPGRAARLLRGPLRGHGCAGAHQGRRRSRAPDARRRRVRALSGRRAVDALGGDHVRDAVDVDEVRLVAAYEVVLGALLGLLERRQVVEIRLHQPVEVGLGAVGVGGVDGVVLDVPAQGTRCTP